MSGKENVSKRGVLTMKVVQTQVHKGARLFWSQILQQVYNFFDVSKHFCT